MIMTSIIRSSRSRAVLAEIEYTPDGPILRAVHGHTGPIPKHEHLLKLFPNISALRQEVFTALRSPAGDTLDRVLLSRAAYEAWLDAVATTDLAGIDPVSVPDEQARPISNGRLKIWVTLPDGREVSLILQPSEWAWRVPEH